MYYFQNCIAPEYSHPPKESIFPITPVTILVLLIPKFKDVYQTEFLTKFLCLIGVILDANIIARYKNGSSNLHVCLFCFFVFFFQIKSRPLNKLGKKSCFHGKSFMSHVNRGQFVSSKNCQNMGSLLV